MLGPYRRAVEPAGGGQDGVADRLGLHAPGRVVVQQAVLRVGFAAAGDGRLDSRKPRVSTSERISRFTDQPSSTKRCGQVIEQLGVRRQFADVAEIIDGADQARAEQVVPDAIDHDPRGQRIVGAGDRLGQLQPAAARGRERLVPGVDSTSR